MYPHQKIGQHSRFSGVELSVYDIGRSMGPYISGVAIKINFEAGGTTFKQQRMWGQGARSFSTNPVIS
jgi:hypothetical protein